MSFDNSAPFANARVNVLLIPGQNLRLSLFSSFASQFSNLEWVSFKDIADADSDLSSPQDSSVGKVLFQFCSSQNAVSTVESFPFELNREPQIIVVLVDWCSFGSVQQNDADTDSTSHLEASEITFRSVLDDYHRIKCEHSRSLVHRLLVFNADKINDVPPDVCLFPANPALESRARQKFLRDLAIALQPSLHELFKHLQDLPMVESPAPKAAKMPIIQENGKKMQHRMSMPAGRSVRIGSSALEGLRSLRVGVEQTSEVNTSAASPSLSPGNSGDLPRDRSHERHSVFLPGKAPPSSPSLTQNKGRLRIILGSILLISGRWLDALRELSEGTAAASASSDYIWQARGLEYVLVCILLLLWSTVPFDIPSVCYHTTEKPGSKESLYAGLSSDDKTGDSGGKATRPVRDSIQQSTFLISSVLNMIFTLYERASSFTSEALPAPLLCEFRIRAVGYLSLIRRPEGLIDRTALNDLVMGKLTETENENSNSLRQKVVCKGEMVTMLYKAIPTSMETLSPNESVEIRIGIAVWLHKLGLRRKRAVVLKEALGIMTRGLMEARKVGAAEVGMHPSAVISNSVATGLNPDQEGVVRLLVAICQMFQIPYEKIQAESDNTGANQIGAKICNWAISREIGDTTLKLDTVRTCITICEALPDLHATLDFSVLYLHIARNAITLPPQPTFGPPLIPLEEQVRVMSSIKRAVGSATRNGQFDVMAQYWDDFLVRGVALLQGDERSRFISRIPQDLVTVATPAASKGKDPFIYSSFSKAGGTADTESILVADEIAFFTVVLQNPFEFDVEIDTISLQGDGCEFVASNHSIVLGHFCSQSFVMSGKPGKTGTLKITGCVAKIRYCHERSFRIFSRQWLPETHIKIRERKFAQSNINFGAVDSGPKPIQQSVPGPDADVLNLTVINAQPTLSLINVSAVQSTVMILEGESKTIQLVLENNSRVAAADLLFFTFEDSATTQLEEALSGRNLNPTDVYELQKQLLGRPSLRSSPDDCQRGDPVVAPGETVVYKFEIFGKPGLTSGIIHINYAHIGTPRSEVKHMFYTRRLSLPISLTVNGAIEIARCNILPFSRDFAWHNRQHIELGSNDPTASTADISFSQSNSQYDGTSQKDRGQFAALLSQLGLGPHRSDHCLMLLDIRNVWPSPLSISIQVRESLATPASPTDLWRRAYTVHDLILPGHSSRIVLLVPRLFVPDAHATIPLFSNQRQFVVSASKISPENETASREAFWYREELLKYIRGSWKEESSGREGEIDVRKGIRLSAKMVEALKLDEIEIEFSIRSLEPTSGIPSKTEKGPVTQFGGSSFILRPDTFASLRVMVHNRSQDRIHALLRLQPSVRSQPHNVALDLSKRFVWTGMLQRALYPPIDPGDTCEVELGIMALCEGNFEINATVEEARIVQREASASNDHTQLLSPKRRIWHAREPCLIDAVRDDGS